MAAIALSELKRIGRLVLAVEIILTFFRYLPVIIGGMAAVSLLLAGLNFAEQDYGWAIVNLLLGLAGILFVAKVIKPNPKHFAKDSYIAH